MDNFITETQLSVNCQSLLILRWALYHLDHPQSMHKKLFLFTNNFDLYSCYLYNKFLFLRCGTTSCARRRWGCITLAVVSIISLRSPLKVDGAVTLRSGLTFSSCHNGSRARTTTLVSSFYAMCPTRGRICLKNKTATNKLHARRLQPSAIELTLDHDVFT